MLHTDGQQYFFKSIENNVINKCPLGKPMIRIQQDKLYKGQADMREQGTTGKTFHIRTSKLEELTDCEGVLMKCILYCHLYSLRQMTKFRKYIKFGHKGEVILVFKLAMI